jgi:single-stranded DNA-binding protein
MTIPPQMSLQGSIATDPDLHFSENGVARFCARVGVRQFRQNADGSTIQLEPTFHDLVIFRKAADQAYESFRKGDTFVATGHINENPYERHGRRIVHKEFVARHIGRNLVLTKYVVERKQSTPPDPDLSTPPLTEAVPEPLVGL